MGELTLEGERYLALDMAFDYTTKTMYLLTDERNPKEGGHLVKLDYLTGQLTDQGLVSGMDSYGLTLACDNQGVLYTWTAKPWAVYAGSGYGEGILCGSDGLSAPGTAVYDGRP